MKNLFNDISQSEKNRILEMHGIKPIISETEQLMTNLKSVTKQQWEKAGSSCFSEAKTPKLYKLLVGAGWGAAAAAAFAATYLSAGAGDGMTGGLFVTSGLFFTAEAGQKMWESIKGDGTYMTELKSLYNCIKQSYFSWLS
jgi:hypothetical protein